MEKTLTLFHRHENYSKWQKNKKENVGRQRGKKIIKVVVFKNILMNGRSEFCLVDLENDLEPSIHKKNFVSDDNGCLDLNSSLKIITSSSSSFSNKKNTKSQKIPKTIFKSPQPCLLYYFLGAPLASIEMFVFDFSIE